VGFVYQFHHLLPEFSALENVAMPLMIAGKRRKEAEARAKETAGTWAWPIASTTSRPRCRAASSSASPSPAPWPISPKLLLADEPTGNLDPATSAAVFQALYQQAREQGVAALIATHNMELARYMDRVFALKDGHLETQTF
jgi:lipoprotein-releasing system ATP-binding protein